MDYKYSIMSEEKEMRSDKMSIAENIKLINQQIRDSERASSRPENSVTLVGATKMNDAARVQEAIAAGLGVCGENRVQEMLEKNAQGAYEGAHLHFIGHLQKNKVKQVVGLAELIHSVDSRELMQTISDCAVKKGIRQDVLLEINIAAEESKSGFSPEEITDALTFAGQLPGIFVRGLMAVPPICAAPEENLPFFHQMEQLFIDNGKKKYDNVSMDFLSMGMSGDYQAAISCGANLVRLGTAIFGQRIYPNK